LGFDQTHNALTPGPSPTGRGEMRGAKTPYTHKASDSAAFYLKSVEFFHKTQCW